MLIDILIKLDGLRVSPVLAAYRPFKQNTAHSMETPQAGKAPKWEHNLLIFSSVNFIYMCGFWNRYLMPMSLKALWICMWSIPIIVKKILDLNGSGLQKRLFTNSGDLSVYLILPRPVVAVRLPL